MPTVRSRTVEVTPSDTPAGRVVRAALGRTGRAALPVHVGGEDQPAPAGTTVRPVTDVAQRVRLLPLADRAERTDPDPERRVPHPRNFDLLDHDLWLVAEDADGVPVLLSVLAVDGEVAAVRFERALGAGPAAGVADAVRRRQLTELAARGVRWLVDPTAPEDVAAAHLRPARRARPEVAVAAIASVAVTEPLWEQALSLVAF